MIPPSEDTNLDKEVVLHHIDKLYLTQNVVWQSMNRIVLAVIAISLLLIALSTGFISLEEAIDVGGIRLKVSLAVLLSGGACSIAAFLTAFLSQWNHADQYGAEIKRLYGTLNYKTPLDSKPDVDAFEVPSFYQSLNADMIRSQTSSNTFVQWSSLLVAAFTLAVLVVVPIGAQVAAGLRVASLFGWRWWIVALFMLLVGLTISLVIATASNDN